MYDSPICDTASGFIIANVLRKKSEVNQQWKKTKNSYIMNKATQSKSLNFYKLFLKSFIFNSNSLFIFVPKKV